MIKVEYQNFILFPLKMTSVLIGLDFHAKVFYFPVKLNLTLLVT